SLEWSIHEVELERAVLALEANASSTTCAPVYELLYLARKNKDIGVGPAQLARVVAMSRQPDISPTMRYQLLVAVCTLLPDPASQPELHRLWLQAVLARDADIDPDLRNSLLDESYHRHHPGALDDEPAATLLTHASVCWKQRLGKTTDALAQSFEQLSGRAHRPADNTHWQGWRVLAAHWLRELVERQNLNSSQHWAQLIQKVQQLAQAHASRPHEWVPRL